MVKKIIQDLKEMSNPKFRSGMSHFGIQAETALGIKIPVLRSYAKQYKKQHELALELWKSKIHEAKILAIMIADPAQVDEDFMEAWIKDFYSWDLVDGACSALFCRHPLAFIKAVEWTKRKSEYEKRSGFSLMAYLAVHDKKAADKKFIDLLPFLEKEAHDERNFVKKAVNWALRQIGKRNVVLHKEAIACAYRIKQQESKSAKWIAADALRELEGEKYRALVKKKSEKKKS